MLAVVAWWLLVLQALCCLVPSAYGSDADTLSGISEADYEAAIDELVQMHDIPRHTFAAALRAASLVGEETGNDSPVAARASNRRLQAMQPNWRRWDLDVLRDSPCASEVVPSAAEIIHAEGSEAVLDIARLGAESGCADPLATNTGTDQACTYECANLVDSYGFEQATATCYIRDHSSQSGWPAELMNQRRSSQDWFFWLPETDASQPRLFDVGGGRSCVNVTVQTLMFSDVGDISGQEEEEVCMLPGVHIIEHDYDGRHNITAFGEGVVVGFSSADIHEGAGGQTHVVVGACEDAVIRVKTTQAAEAVVWTLDDPNDIGERHMGPWQFESPAGPGTIEFSVCLFANTFEISKSTSEWTGTVSVLQTRPDYSIVLPTEGSIIVQGSLNAAGTPQLLDARLTCGSVHEPSFANLVIRDVRFSGLNAPEDVDAAHRKYSHNNNAVYPVKSFGAAVQYHGGWGATLAFERVVFDHLRASSGAGVGIDGLMGLWAREPHPLRSEEQRKMTVTFDGCLAWQTRASWVGGMLRILNVQPIDLVIRDSQFIDNTAVVGSAAAQANYPNVYDDFDGDGMDGSSTWTFERLEITTPNYNDGQNILHELSFLYFPGWDNTVTGTEMNASVEELYMHDITKLLHAPGLNIYFASHTNSPGAGALNVQLSNSHMENVQGISSNSPYAGNAGYHLADTYEMDHSRVHNCGTAADLTETGISEGVIHLGVLELGRFSHSSFSNLVSADGGAIFLAGPGRLEIVSCIFVDGLAWANGGAVMYKGLGGFLVHDSLFVGNRAALDRRQVLIDVTIRVYTGAAGVFLTEESDVTVPDSVLAIWKIDGATPDPMSGAVPANETVYGNGTSLDDGNGTSLDEFLMQQRTYSWTLALSQGTHRLWHGVIANTPGVARGWIGNGWIDVVDIQSKVFPQVIDNRATPDANGVARMPGCYNGNANSDTQNIELCPVGQAFWSYTDFTVPYGIGGALGSTGTGTIVIANSRFEENLAGRGNVLSAIGPEAVVIRNSSVQALEPFSIYLENGAPQSTCQDVPCGPGEKCSFEYFSLVCTTCQPNEIGDGRDCSACPPGSQPNAEQSVCELCPLGYKSSVGYCDLCETGKVSASDRVTCVHCLPGTATGSGPVATTCQECDSNTFSAGQQVECTACPPGQQPNEANTGCEDCPLGTAGFDGTCSACPPGYQPDDLRSSCQRCFGIGEHSTTGTICTVCVDGTRPNTELTGCDACPAGTAGRSGVCAPCGAGTQPRDDSTQCEDCEGGTFSAGGSLCTMCEPGKTTNVDRSGCEPCGLSSVSIDGSCVECVGRHVPNSDRSKCICKPGTYSQLHLGLIVCHGDVRESNFDDECIECASCLNCAELGVVQSSVGWAFYGAPGDAFKCPLEEACPAENMVNISSTVQTECALGYTGPVCADCDDGYNHLKVGEPCDDCVGNVVNVPALIGLVFIILAAAATVISGMADALRDHAIITDIRILIGFWQLLASMGNVLNISLPAPIPQIVGFIKLLFLDLRAIIRLDCWDVGGLYSKLVTNVFVIPILFFCGCFVIYQQQKKTATMIIAGGGADESALTHVRVKFKQNVFVGIFLVYPTITSTLFRFPQCRSLGEDSFHEEDYSVDCSSSTFLFTGILTLILILCIPVGVPLGFLYAMNQQKALLGEVNVTTLGGAKLIEADADDEDDGYAFLISSYIPEYWFYCFTACGYGVKEIVTYVRKLLLGGLSVVMARGTMAQIYFCAFTEAVFLCYHFRTYPFVLPKHNIMDGLGHLCIILTYVTCIVLRQQDEGVWEEEVVQKTGYGYVMQGFCLGRPVYRYFVCFMFLVVLPAPTVYYLINGEKKAQATDELGFEIDNPLHPETEPFENDGGSKQLVPVARATLSKFQREAKETQAQVKKLQTKLAQAEAKLKRSADPDSVQADMEMLANVQTEAPAKIQVDVMKELAADESLSEEVREAAKKTMSLLVTTQIAETNREAEQAATLSELRSEEEFDEQLFKQLGAKNDGAATSARQDLLAWLGANRLLRYAEVFLRVVGKDAHSSDLVFLTKENIETIGEAMTHVEQLRLATALQALREKDHASVNPVGADIE